MSKIKAATQAVVKAAKELHIASKLEELASNQSCADVHTKAARRLIRARGKHYNAVESLLKLEAVSVKVLRELDNSLKNGAPERIPEKIHYSGGLRWVTGTKLTGLLAGFPACSQVRKVNDWKLSEDFRKVTCLRCLHLIKLADNSS